MATIGFSMAPKCGLPMQQLLTLAVVWAKTEEGVKGFIVEKDMPGFVDTGNRE